MKALINKLHNNFVVQVEENEFDVATPLYWVDCPDNIVAYKYQYIDEKFVPYTAFESEVAPQQTKEELLAELAALTDKINALGAA